MKHYNVWLRRDKQVEIVEGFLSMREVKEFLKSQGFCWSQSQGKWEQTYVHVDPFSDYEIDTAWTEATVIAEIVGEDVGAGYVREVA